MVSDTDSGPLELELKGIFRRQHPEFHMSRNSEIEKPEDRAEDREYDIDDKEGDEGVCEIFSAFVGAVIYPIF